MNLEQLLQAVGASDTPKRTLNTLLVSGLPSPPSPTLGSVVSPMGIIEPEAGVARPVEEGVSPLGFVSNLVSGSGMLLHGLTSLVGAAGHDVVKGIASAVPDNIIDASIEESPTALLGMAGSMLGYDEWMPSEISGNPAEAWLGIPSKLGLPEGEDAPSMIMEDLKTRWGPLLRGDIAEFASQMYEKPISFGLDALMVAGAPGAAGRGAGYLAKGAPVMGVQLARPLAKSASLGTMADYLMKFRVPSGAALGNRSVRYPIGGDPLPVGVTPGGVYIPSIAEMAAVQRASIVRKASINPLVRLAQRGIHNLSSTKTVPGIGMPVTQALGMLDDPAKQEYLFSKLALDLGSAKGLDYGNQLAIAKLLMDGATARGYTTSPRLYKPWARQINQTHLMRMRQAAHGAALIDLRELTNEYNRKFLDTLDSADDVMMVEDMLNGTGDHRTPMDSSLWGSRNFQAEADMAAMGTEPYQLGWDARLNIPPGRRGVDIPDYANEPNMFEGMENIPRREDRPPMLVGEETFRGFTELDPSLRTPDIQGPLTGNSLYPNPAVTDIAGGAGDVTRAQAAGLARGDRVMFYDGSQAKYLSTKPYTYSDGTVGPIDYFDFGNGPEMEPKLEWVKLEKGAQEGTETAAEMQSRLLGDEFAPRVATPAKGVPAEKIEPVSGYPDRYIVTYTDDGGNAISFGVRKAEGTTQGTRQAGAGGVVANRRTKTVWKIDKDPYGISYPTRKAAIEDYKRSRATTGGVADEMTAAGKADAARRAELKAAAERSLGDEIYANHEQVAAIEAAHPDQTFLSTDSSTGIGPERITAPEGDAFVTMTDDANIYRYSRNTGELLETTARRKGSSVSNTWNIEDVVGEKKVENLEELGVNFDDMPTSVIDWLDEGGKVEEWIKSWLNSGDDEARQFIDDWGRNVDGFRTLKAPAAVGWRKIVFGTGDEDFVLVPMNRADKAQFFKRVKDTMTEREDVPVPPVKKVQNPQTVEEMFAKRYDDAEPAEPPKVAETSDELKAIAAANEKIQILRDQGIDVSQEQAAIIIAEEVQKAGGVMELAKAKPVAAKPSVAPAILKEGEGRAVWNGIELKPNTEHTIKVLGWKRNLKVTIKGEATLNDQLGIRYVRKTQKGGESSNFAPYNSIEAIDGKQRQVSPPRVAQPQPATPAPTLKATATAKPKVEPKPAPKAATAEAFQGLDVGTDTGPWTPVDPLLPETPETFAWADETPTGPWESPFSNVEVPLDYFTILDENGFVKATFATKEKAAEYANVYGGNVVLPGLKDKLPPIKVSEPTVPLTPPPVTPFRTRFDELPPENIPHPTNLSEKPMITTFQALIGDPKKGNVEYRGAEMFSTPWYTSQGDTYRPARFFHYIDDMRKVDEYVSSDGQKTGARLLGVRNTLNDGGDIDPRYGAWRAYDAWFETPDGDVFEVQYLTPDMAAHVEAASNVWKRIDGAETQFLDHQAAIRQVSDSIPEGKKPTKAQLKEMADHAEEMAKLSDEILALKKQASGFNEGIVRELANPDGYDKRYKAFDQIRSNWYNSQVSPEFGHLPYSALSASQQLDRAYLTAKVKKYDLWLMDLRGNMEALLKEIPDDVEVNRVSVLKGVVAKNLQEMLKSSRHREDLAALDNGPFETRRFHNAASDKIHQDGISAWVDETIPDNTRTPDPVAYVLNKLDEFTSQAVSDGRASDKAVAFWQDMFNYRWSDMDAEYPQGTLPGYFPHIKMATKGPGGYLGRMHNLNALNTGEPEALRRATGALARNKNFASTRLLDSFEDYRRMPQFKNATPAEIHLQRLNDAKQLIEDVYSLRATQLTRHRQVLDFIDEIKAMSRPVTPVEMPLWSNGMGMPGYKLINFDQLKTHVSLRGKMFDKMFKEMSQQTDFGRDFDKVAVQALKEVLDEAEAAALKSLTDGGGIEGTLYAVPEHLVSEFNRNIGRAMGWKVRFGVDAPMNVWKQAVLSFSPRWFVNNTIGNTIFTLIKDPSALLEMVRLRDEKYKQTMRYVFEGAFPEGVERGLFAKSTQRVTDYGFAESVAPRTADTYRLLRGQPSAIAMQAPEVLKPGLTLYQKMAQGMGKTGNALRGFNTAIEDTFRTAVFSSQIRKAVTRDALKGFGSDLKIFEAIQTNPVRKQQWISEAITQLNMTLGDYTNLTPVERNIFRRFILPFYPFYKHSAKFLLRMPIDHPFKAAALLTLGKLDEEMMKDFPEYLSGTVGIGWWGGQQLLMRFRGMNPLSVMGTQGVSGLNPVLQQLISYTFGINTFTGEPLTDGDVLNDFAGNKVLAIRDDQGNIIGMKALPDGYKVHPSAYRMLTTMIPQANVLGGLWAGATGGDTGARYSGSGELIMDPISGEPKYPQPWFKDPAGWAGLPLSTIDPYELARDQQAKRDSLLDAWRNR